MNQTIVVLLILLIIMQLTGISRNLKKATKGDEIKYHENKLEEAKQSSISDNVKITAFLTVLLIDIAIIYFSVQAIFSLVK